MKSIDYNIEIKDTYSLHENENISISISLDNQKSYDEYIIKYALIYSDPQYTNLYDYVTYKDDNYATGGDKIEYYEDEYIDEYIGRSSYFKIIKNGFISTNCENDKFSLCKQETDNEICIIYINEETDSKTSSSIPIIYSDSDLTEPIIYSDSYLTYINKNDEIKKCSINEILNNNCKEEITDEQIDEIYKDLKKILI